MYVVVSPQPAFSFTPGTLLFEKSDSESFNGNAAYDVAAEDGRFLLIKSNVSATAPSPINVVLNWSAGRKQ